MVKTVFICLAMGVLCGAAPQHQFEPQPAPPLTHPDAEAVQILKQDAVVGVDGYHFEFETSDGTAREEQGQLKNLGTAEQPQPGLSVRGSYRYVAPDGQAYAVTYLADENGFQPSEHLEPPRAAHEELAQSLSQQ